MREKLLPTPGSPRFWSPGRPSALKILILSFSWVQTQPRVLRQISSLSTEHEVTVAGYGPLSIPNVSILTLKGLASSTNPQLARFPLGLRVFRAALAFFGSVRLLYWVFHPAVRHAKKSLREKDFDLVIANELETVPLAMKIARGVPVVADLHEYTPGHLEPGSLAHLAYQRYRLWLTGNYLGKPAALITVGKGISKLYEANWGVSPLHIVRNAPRYEELAPSDVYSDRIELVYHGLGGPGRGLEAMLKSLKGLPLAFEAHFYIAGGGGEALRARIAQLGLENRASVHPPVPTVDIAKTINKHDVAVVFHEPHTENFRDSLPNKFFESIQARLAIVVGPSPEMSNIVDTHRLGVVTEDYSVQALREALLSLDREKITGFKRHASSAAVHYCWEHEEKVFLEVVSEV